MEGKHCPICPRQCDLSNPHCPRGMRYAQTGEIPKHKHHKNHLSFENREQQLVMKYLHHAVRVADSGDITQDDAMLMFDVLSDDETKELAGLLEKLSDHWIAIAKTKK